MHVIRLRKPWNKLADGDTDSIRIDVPEPEPDTDAKSNEIDRATYQRFFNRPSGLDANSSVLLRVTRWQGRLESISLNGETLEPHRNHFELDIANRLRDRNELVITLVSSEEDQCLLSGEVSLAIDTHPAT